HKLKYKNTVFYFLDNEYYFKRDKAYGYYDDGERIAFFSKALLESIIYMDFKPDILHLNDWHTALSAVYLREMYQGLEDFRKLKTIFTVHNLKFQGKFDPKMLDDPLDLARYPDARRQLLQKDAVNFMLGALNYADCITTVSPTYAEEVKNAFFGEGLEDVFNRRESIFKGIINGIDYENYNPKTDKNLFANYDIETIEEKAKNKIGLQKELGLEVDKDVCVVGLVSRLTDQKGMDLLCTIFEELINTMHMQFVLLGQGDAKYEDSFRYFENKYKGKVSSSICFSEERSRRIYAASDLFLVPSIFEPCGLSQLIAMRYLSLPVVRKTGGLKDTVEPYNKFTNEGTGFAFQNINAHDLLFTLKEAIALYYDDREVFDGLIKNASAKDYSWLNSAREYKKLYQKVLGIGGV
ncbi:MAG: glycogen synthase, partial [Lachnospiraceae bacterium]|nr:glycogen synthase [Lachnospiraceae bacterium]